MSVYPPNNPIIFQSHWHDFINYFKTMQYPDPRSIMRLSLTDEEVENFW